MTKIYNKRFIKLRRQELRRQMPKAEEILWARLRRRQIEGVKFRRQYSVDRFILDFYCPELKLAIEIDGPTHQSTEAQNYDQFRQQHIEELEIQFLRFTNREVYQSIDDVLDAIRQKILAIQS